MYGLSLNHKEKAKEEILAHFIDQEFEEISHHDLSTFSHQAIQEIRYTSGSEKSTLVAFSAYQAAVIFIHQALFETSDSSFFDRAIVDDSYKEDVERIIEVSTSFAQTYLELTEAKKIKTVNKVLVLEIKKTMISVKNDHLIRQAYQSLFTVDDSYLPKNHLQYIKGVYETLQDASCQKMKCLKKEDALSLLMLYRIYHDGELIKAYEGLKLQSNLAQSTKIQEEIKSIATDYMQSKDKLYIAQVNRFFLGVCASVKHMYMQERTEEAIEMAFKNIEGDIKQAKWYDILLMRKDTWVLQKMTLKTHRELQDIYQGLSSSIPKGHYFKNNFSLFSALSTLIYHYDHYFDTIATLSEVLEYDFTGSFEMAGMNLKNFYEATEDDMELEVMHHFFYFWMQLNEKILAKKSATLL